MNIKVYSFFFVTVTLTAIELALAIGRNFRHETIIKRRLSEARHALEAVKTRHFAVLLPLDDAVARNFTAIGQHGDFVTSYLVRNAQFEIERVEFEASKRGIHVDACVARIRQIMSALPKTAANDINTSKEDFIAKYHRLHEQFAQRANRIEGQLKEAERLQVECHLEAGCFEMVLMQIEDIERHVNAQFVNDLKLQFEGFMMKMQQQYHAMQGIYLQLYEGIRRSEEEFRNCYKARLSI